MKSKGFTLSEILAVLVILGILITIGTPVYFVVTNNVKENELNSKIKYLEAQAVKYANDEGFDHLQTITASTLVAAGYIVPDRYVNTVDEQLPFIINPVDNEDNLACRIINIDLEDYDYVAKVSSDSNCGIVSQQVLEDKMGIKVYAYEDGKITKKIVLNSLSWVNHDVAIIINPDYSDLVSARISHNGTTKELDENVISNPEIGSSISEEYSNVVIVRALSLLVDHVNVNIMVGSTEKTADLEVKIDKEAPIIRSTSYDGWTSDNKKVAAYLSDGNGSGARGAYITNTSDIDAYKGTKLYLVNNDKENIAYIDSPHDNGIYYLWAVDKIGNVSLPTEIKITNVDNVAPECLYPNTDGYRSDNSSWTREPITIYWGCRDGESGCKDGMNGGSRTFNNETVEQYVLPEFVISDNAGNTITCPSRVINVYHDSVPPECTVSGEKTNWTAFPVKITYGCSDAGIGCDPKQNGGVKMYGTGRDGEEIKTSKLNEYTVSDLLGNSRVCYPGGKQVNIYYDKKKPKITAKSNPLLRDGNNYDLVNNLNISDTGSGVKYATCDPGNTSVKGNKGIYDVVCYVYDNVGNYNSVKFTTKHQYKAYSYTGEEYDDCTRYHKETYCPSEYNYECEPTWCPDWASSCVSEKGWGAPECGCKVQPKTTCCDEKREHDVCDSDAWVKKYHCNQSYDVQSAGDTTSSTCYYCLEGKDVVELKGSTCVYK